MNYHVALAQINPTVGDISGNADKIIRHINVAGERGAEFVVFPEFVITGYPPKDLLLKPSFIKDNRDALDRIITETDGLAVVTSFVDTDGKKICNAGCTHKRRGAYKNPA